MATIVIGIGGVGKVVLMKLRRAIVEEYGELRSDMGFLHIDTFEDPGPEGGQDFTKKVLGTDITLSPTERLVLSKGLPRPPHTKELTEHPHVKEWFPPDLPVNVDLAQGAGGVRAYGRLAFHHKVADMRAQLNQKLAGADGGASANIYIVSSFFGGTGSGSFLDVCYVARDVKQQLGLGGEVLGFFIVGATRLDAVMQSNCYAALMELEYYTTSHLLGPQGKPFEVRYPVAGVPPVVAYQPPVDTCYLIGTNNGRKLFNRSELEEMVARRIFLESVPGIKDPLIAKRVDINATPAYYTPDTYQQRAKTFFATGCSVIEFPAPRLMNGLGAALAAYSCQFLLYRNARGFSDLKGAIRDLIKSKAGVELTEASLKKEFEKQDTRTVSTSMKEDRFKWLTDLRTRIKEGAIREGTLHSDAENVVVRAVDSIGEKGAYALTVTNNMEKAWAKAEGNIDTMISSCVTDSDIGPAHSIDFIDALIKELKNDQTRANSIYSSADTVLRRLRERVNRRLNRIKEDETFRWEAGKHIEWLCNRELAIFMEQGIRRIVYEAITTLFNRVIGKLETSKAQIETYGAYLNKTKESFIEEAGGVCSNLADWVRGEAQEGRNHLNHLDAFLAKMVDLVDINLIYSIFSTLAASYNIPDPFDGNIDAKVRTIIGSLGSSPFETIRSDPHAFKKNLFMTCRSTFGGIGSVNVCDLLNTTLQRDVRDNLFKEKIDDSMWFLEASTDDPAIAHDPALHEKKWVGVPNGIDLLHHPVWNGILEQYNPNSQRFNAVREPYRMVFATEMGVFCLRNVKFLGNYAEGFRRLSSEERKRRHTNSKIEFLDVMPPDPRVATIVSKSESASLLGRIFGFLEEATDPETHFKAIYLHYTDQVTTAKMNERLCDRWDEVVKTLRDKQVTKDVDKQYTGVTPLELLNDQIDRFAKSKRTREEKQELFNTMQDYLRESLRTMEGDEKDKERHPAYQKMVRLTNEFLKQYQVTAAESD